MNAEHREESAFDVIVIGGGGSGLAAAIEARAAGRDVLLLEKNPELGGSTAWSIGSVTASQTPHQARKGVVDNPADHWRDMAGFNGDLDARDNVELRRVLADEMPDTFRWLLQHGVRFYCPMPEPPLRVVKNGTKMREMFSAATPGPSSEISSVKRPSL